MDEGQLVDISNDDIDTYLQAKLYRLMGLLRAKEVTKGSIGEGIVFRKRKHAVNEWSFGKFVSFVLKECKDDEPEKDSEDENNDYDELDLGDEDEDEEYVSDNDDHQTESKKSVN